MRSWRKRSLGWGRWCSRIFCLRSGLLNVLIWHTSLYFLRLRAWASVLCNGSDGTNAAKGYKDRKWDCPLFGVKYMSFRVFSLSFPNPLTFPPSTVTSFFYSASLFLSFLSLHASIILFPSNMYTVSFLIHIFLVMTLNSNNISSITSAKWMTPCSSWEQASRAWCWHFFRRPASPMTPMSELQK